MSGFDTPIPGFLVGIWLICVALAAGSAFVRFREVIGWRYRALLALLRVLAAGVVLIILLQPYTETRVPDREGFRVALLADASHSMSVRDIRPEGDRASVVRDALDKTRVDGLLRRLESRYNVSTFFFSDELRPARLEFSVAGQERRVLPGPTAIGDVLNDCLSQFTGVPLGGVLLLSDGHSNEGTPVSEAAKQLRSRGIPVSCVGIGELLEPGDVRVRFSRESFEGVKGSPLLLHASLDNRFSQAVTVRIRLTEHGTTLEERDLTLPPNQATPVEFSPIPWSAGFRIYGLAIDPVPADRRRDNDADFAAVKVREPDVFRLLYLGGHLTWEYRFLKILCDGGEQLQLAAVIRTGPENYYKTGFPERLRGREKGFPGSEEVLNHFDAILLDTRILSLLSADALDRIIGFVENRGGGLLVFGPLDYLPEGFSDLMPVRATDAPAFVRDARVDVSRQFIFTKDASGALRSPRGLPLGSGEPVWLAAKIKSGARAAARLRGDGPAVLTAQSYGSGRVAYAGFENTWKWRLGDAAGLTAHSEFWQTLLVWLGSTGKKRVRAACDGAKVGLGEEVALDLDVLGTDFRPAPDARISAAITSPGGEESVVHLDPTGDAPGRYSAVFFPEESGAYTVRYRIRTRADKLEYVSHFLGQQTGTESEDTSYRESTLRDLARITEGSFRHYPDLDTITELPLSKDIAVRVERRYWSDSWLPLVLLIAALAAEWYCRRRIGLK